MIFFSEKQGICDRIFLSQNIYEKTGENSPPKKNKKKKKNKKTG
jgi:hypothetical protein